MDKREFKKQFGFYPHQEKCANCNKRRADHSIWNTANKCKEFKSTGEKA